MIILAEGYQLDVTWGLVASVFGGFVLCMGFITVAVWKVWTTWQGLKENHTEEQNKRTKEDQERADRMAAQDADVRESLLNRFRQMYELEKERGSSEIHSVNEKVDRLSREVIEWDEKYRSLRSDYDQLKEKYDRVVMLNIQYQSDKSRDTAEITRLTASLNDLRRQVNILDHKSHDDQ